MKLGVIAALVSLGAIAAPIGMVYAQPDATSPKAYVAAAAASDMFEIQSSQLALQKARRADVKDFARMMVDHHTATSKDLAMAAQSAKAGPPPTALPADKAQKLAMLRKTPENGFDAAYLRDQVTGHEEALALHKSYAANGGDAVLKRAAAKTAPIVQSHLTRAQALAAAGAQ